MATSFEEFFQTATGHGPHPAQATFAADGLPTELLVPTGTDGAATAVLPWLYRRLIGTPATTPRRLVYVLPAQSLPERLLGRLTGWLGNLGLSGEVGTYLLAGAVRDGGWLRHPERTAILVGTHDLLLSRAVMRGFADSRRTAPVEYGLLHNDAQWVFDGARLLGPGLATSVRLQRLRDTLGTSAPTASLWMSSVPEPADPRTGELGTGPMHPYFRPADRRDLVARLGERDPTIIGTRASRPGIGLSCDPLLSELGADEVGEPGADQCAWTTSDFLALFDTAADPPDLDVSSWICDPADRTALVAWRAWEAGEPAEDEPLTGREELCPVPLDELRRFLDDRGAAAWLRDPRDGLWRHATPDDLGPGVLLLLDARYGGYLPDQGWSPDSTTPVATLPPPSDSPMFACVHWVSLDQHLIETEIEARKLLDALPGLPGRHHQAVTLAARYHDLGKSHEVFQELLRAGGGDPPDLLLAKSKAPYSTGRSRRLGFRHELVSALILTGTDRWHRDETDHDLVTYLVAAHHGQVRISIRADPDEAPAILGVLDGDQTPSVTLSTGETFPAQSLHTIDFRPELGGTWSDRARTLRDRADLGPFRLAYLEALVRIADWRSSALHDGPVEAPASEGSSGDQRS